MISNSLRALRWSSCRALVAAGILVGLPIQAAEFVIAPNGDKASTPRDSAASMRDRARAQRGEEGSAIPLTTIIEGLEESPFGGRSGGATTENRNRARSYQQGGDGTTPLDIDRLLIDPESNRGRVKSNLDRAHAYQQGRSPGVTNSRMGGTENLPLVDCGAVQNNTGRIGDDVQSGAVLTIMKGDRGVRVRCK
jgi:hypothetical protein